MTSRLFLRTVATASVLVGHSACTDMSTPAELSHPQIVAVCADPPVVAPAESSQLSVLVAGPDGVIRPDSVRWSDNVEVDNESRARFTAPAEVGDDGALVQVDVEVEVQGDLLLASKRIGVGILQPSENPRITQLLADGEPLNEDGLVLSGNATVLLDVAVSPAPSATASYAWYSTVGEIDLYRHAPTDLLAPGEVAAGTLIAVYRDGLGVAWRAVPVSSSP